MVESDVLLQLRVSSSKEVIFIDSRPQVWNSYKFGTPKYCGLQYPDEIPLIWSSYGPCSAAQGPKKKVHIVGGHNIFTDLV